MTPLFPGVPGGPELLVVLLLMVGLFGLPVVIALLGWRHLRGGTRVGELESRVEALEDELDEVDPPESASVDAERDGGPGRHGTGDPDTTDESRS